MTLSILQLNSNADNFWDRLIPFLTSQDFDIINLQEVAGKDTLAGNINATRNCFVVLQTILAPKYKGELAIADRFTSSQSSYLGNAIFYKKEFSLVKKDILPLHQRPTPFPSDAKTFEDAGRNILHLRLQVTDAIISFLNIHAAWAKTSQEESHQTKQGEILLHYLKKVPHPFVFSGDFNLDPQQPTIQKLNQLARNLTAENQITNTLNPRTHRAQELFPKGVAVDYIFVSRDIEVKKFKVLEEDLSDHLGLTAEITT